MATSASGFVQRGMLTAIVLSISRRYPSLVRASTFGFRSEYDVPDERLPGARADPRWFAAVWPELSGITRGDRQMPKGAMDSSQARPATQARACTSSSSCSPGPTRSCGDGFRFPSATPSGTLHVAIQDAMGWLDYHLHEFRLPHAAEKQVVSIGIPTDEDPADAPVLPGWGGQPVALLQSSNVVRAGGDLRLRFRRRMAARGRARGHGTGRRVAELPTMHWRCAAVPARGLRRPRVREVSGDRHKPAPP